jgi:hypothetical protein
MLLCAEAIELYLTESLSPFLKLVGEPALSLWLLG